VSRPYTQKRPVSDPDTVPTMSLNVLKAIEPLLKGCNENMIAGRDNGHPGTLETLRTAGDGCILTLVKMVDATGRRSEVTPVGLPSATAPCRNERRFRW
jgi:hypothetical protein